MSNNEYEFEDDLDFEDGGNDVMKQLRKANRAKEKELSELKAKMSELAAMNRDRTIKDVFSARGINPKIASLVPKDIDLTEESLSAWLDEYADALGVQATNTQTQQPNVPEGFQQQYQRQQAAMDASISADRERQIQSQMEEAAAKGPEALKQFFAEMAAQGL